MVSKAGVLEGQPLVVKIDSLETSIQNIEQAIKAGATVWQMEASVYINTRSATLGPLKYDLPADDSTKVLTAVKDALQVQLDILNAQLKEIQ